VELHGWPIGRANAFGARAREGIGYRSVTESRLRSTDP